MVGGIVRRAVVVGEIVRRTVVVGREMVGVLECLPEVAFSRMETKAAV
jgi:hypothetical protein